MLWGLVLQGLTLGLLTSLVALGMALVYRANRIINFAQGDLGLVPAALAIDLVVFSGLDYFLALAIGLVAAPVVGAVVELAVVRRFFRSPRLILTVATIGLAQLLAFCSLMLPRLWGEDPLNTRIDGPISWRAEVAPLVFDGDYLVAWVLGPLAVVAVALFLRFTHVGIAVRAAADRADRAALLGIPVGRLHTFVWAIAATLSFLALYLMAGVVGVPLGSPVGLTVLLSALAALMLGRLTDMPAIVVSGMALGLLETHVRWNDELAVGPVHLDLGSDYVVAPVLAVVILVALVARRRGVTRADSDATSSWQAAGEVRPVPPELATVGEVRLVRWVVLIAVAAALVALPTVLGPGETLKAGAVVIFALVILSITVLTGWAGQVSLGQMGFVAIGAALGAHAVQAWGWDLAITLPVAGLVGAAVATVVGLPALRLRGLYLAVTTLAFSLATTRYVLNAQFFDWVPSGRVRPGPVLGVWHLDDPTSMYQLALGTCVLVLVAVVGVRHSRTGRVLVALRENERAAAAFGVSVVRAKLTAFALSGFIASVAGVLLVAQQGRFTLGLFPEEDNLVVFTAAVVGGLGSITGAAIGALFLKGGDWFLQDAWRLFASSIGVLIVLLLLPGGLGGALFRARDLWLRWVARRHDIVVPSLVADVRRLEESAGRAFEARAGTMAEEARMVAPDPSTDPPAGPAAVPSAGPTAEPSTGRLADPSAGPAAEPPAGPAAEPPAGPSAEPSAGPSAGPAAEPSAGPSAGPAAEPSAGPSAGPAAEPSAGPPAGPAAEPSTGRLADPADDEPAEAAAPTSVRPRTGGPA
jgi:branched-chain amino acid transport system permease protein